MKKLGFLLILSFMPQNASACTGAYLSHQSQSLLAHSFDYSSKDGYVMLNSRGLKKTGTKVAHEMRSPSWRSKYGSVSLNNYGRERPQVGMNERGLVVSTYAFHTKYKFEPVAKKESMISLEWGQYLLDNFTTTQEVVSHAHDFNILQVMEEVHLLVCDRANHCAVFEPQGSDWLVVDHVEEKGASLANDTYEESLKKWNEYQNNAENKKSSRFVMAMESVLQAQKSEVSLWNQALAMLERVKQPGYSKWHSIFNNNENKIWFRSDLEKEMKLIDLSLLDFSCKKPNLAWSLHQEISRKQEVTYQSSLLTRVKENETVRRVFDIRQNHLVKRYERDLLKNNNGVTLTEEQEKMLKKFAEGLSQKIQGATKLLEDKEAVWDCVDIK